MSRSSLWGASIEREKMSKAYLDRPFVLKTMLVAGSATIDCMKNKKGMKI